jgi:RNA polymerase sigma factor (sigma-70 family)
MITDDELVAARPRLVRACRSICGSKYAAEFEDLAQETLKRAIEHRDQFEPGNLSGFLNSIARRIHKDRLRHGRYVDAHELREKLPAYGRKIGMLRDEDPVEAVELSSTSMLPQEAVEALHRALERMQKQPPKFAEALMMVSLYGPIEAGERTGQNPMTLKSLAKRCRDRM